MPIIPYQCTADHVANCAFYQYVFEPGLALVPNVKTHPYATWVLVGDTEQLLFPIKLAGYF